MRAFLYLCHLALGSLMPAWVDAACVVESGPRTRALIELYTSEGCSSCPPADQRLAQLPTRGADTDGAVALALHVNYWDYIGWKDPYAQSAFGQRQQRLAQANHSQVYTPQFFIAGRSLPNWRGLQNGWNAALREVQKQPARADITLRVDSAKPHAWAISASAQSALSNAPLALFLALTEDGLSSQVNAGENRGVLLRHEHVVREWIGPLPLIDGKLQWQRELALDPAWRSQRLALVGFVQNTASGEVLQALSSGTCPL